MSLTHHRTKSGLMKNPCDNNRLPYRELILEGYFVFEGITLIRKSATQKKTHNFAFYVKVQ